MEIPTKEENPNGLHQRYAISKIVGCRNINYAGKVQRMPILKEIDENSEYFVLRLDDGGKDPKHIAACRKAVLTYAEEIKDHIPGLSKDLIERYS